jgi:hypothetical protein
LFEELQANIPLEAHDGPEVWESVYSQRLLLLSMIRKETAGDSLYEFDSRMEGHLLELLQRSFKQAVHSQYFDVAKAVVREMKRLSTGVFPSSALLQQAFSGKLFRLNFRSKMANFRGYLRLLFTRWDKFENTNYAAFTQTFRRIFVL